MKSLKKLMAVGIISVLLLTGCNSGGNKGTDAPIGNDEKGEEVVYKIGINQLMEHQALDDARKGLIDGLEELGVKAEFDIQNAQGDVTVAQQIADKFISDKVDLIYSIATPNTQASATALGNASSSIPLVFSAVTDAVASGLVESNEKPGGLITGVSDAADVKSQLELFNKLDPSIKTIGIIYNTSEENSAIQVKQVEEIAPEVGLEVKTQGINSINDMSQTLQTLLSKVDALYVVSDNMVASSIELVKDALIERKMVSVSGEESQVAGGILITLGSSYYEMGKQVANIAKSILVDGKDPGTIPVELGQNAKLKVNRATLEALGLDEKAEVFKGAEFID